MKRIRWKVILAFVLAFVIMSGSVPVTRVNASEAGEGISVSGNEIGGQITGEGSEQGNQDETEKNCDEDSSQKADSGEQLNNGSGEEESSDGSENKGEEKEQGQNSKENKDLVNDTDNQNGEDKEAPKDEMESSYGAALMSEGEIQGITINSISFPEGNQVILDDMVTSKSIPIEMDVTGEGLETWNDFELKFKYTDSYGNTFDYSIMLFYDSASGKYKGETHTFTYQSSEAEYKLSKIIYRGTNEEIAYDNPVEFSMVKNNTDHEAPEITDIKVYHNDEEIAFGEKFQKTDALEVRVKASGAEKVSVSFQTFSDDIAGSTSKEVNVVYDQTLDCYIGTFSLEDMYATNWRAVHITAYDIYNNHTQWICSEKGINFWVEDGENTYVPTYTCVVEFYKGNYEWEQITVENVECNTSLAEMFPEGIPYTKKEDFEFLGWYLEKDGRYITETEEFQIENYDNYNLRIYPEYTEREINVSIYSLKPEGYQGSETKTVRIKNEATYQDLCDFLMDSVEHYDGLTLEKWTSNEFTEDELGDRIPRNEADVSVSAEYKEVLVSSYIKYTKPDGSNVYESKEFLVDKDTTCEELETLVNSWGIEHHNKLGFHGWKISIDGEEKSPGDILTTDYSVSADISAEYEKILVDLTVSYFSPDKYTKREDMEVVVNRESTYGDIIGQVDFSKILHYSGVKLVGWKITDYYADKLDNKIEEYSGRVNISAEYEKNPINISCRYYDSDYNIIYVSDVFLFEKDVVTYNDILKELGLDKASHGAELGFAGWTERDLTGSLDTAVDRTWVNFVPQYTAENIVDVLYYYYDKQSKYHEYQKAIVYQDGDTYGRVRDKIVEKYLISDDEHKDGFAGWFFFYRDENYNECSESDVITGKGSIICSAGYKTNGSGNTGNTGGSTDSGNAGGTGDWDNIGDSDEADTTPTVTKPNETVQESLPEIPRLTQETQILEFPALSAEEDSEEAGEVLKLEESVIVEKVEEARNAEEGTSLVIEMTTEDGETATEIPVAVLETVKGKNVEIVLDMGSYSWTINGKDIQEEELEAINLQVIIDSGAIDTSVVEEFANGEPTRQITLVHNGEFGFKATLTINVGSQYEGETGNLYYYNSDGELEFIDAGQIDAEGNVNLDFSHASDYVVVIGRDRTEEESKAMEESVPAEIIDEEVISVEEEVETTGNGLIFIIIVLVVIAAVAGIVLVKKNKK